MGIRNHLTRKRIVDVNGKHNTVHVKALPNTPTTDARAKVLSMAPRASTTYMDTMAPTPMHRTQLALIAEAGYDLRERMAADVYRSPIALEILASDPDPIVRNIVSQNPSSNAKALSNIVTQEANPFAEDEDIDERYQSDTLTNIALHSNADYETLLAVSNFHGNDEGASLAYRRINGQYVSDPRLAYAS